MLVTHPIEIDLTNPGTTPRIHVKQGERLSRIMALRLFDNGTPWEVPDGAAVLIRYHVHDLDESKDSAGAYDTLPDGAPAAKCTGNLVRFMPLPQMLIRHAIVTVDILFSVNESVLATCNVEFYVNQAPYREIEATAGDYYRVVTLEQINKDLEDLWAKVNALQGEVSLLSGETAEAAT